MPDISDLGLDQEATPQVDWDAPEMVTSPPPVKPGTYVLRFKMPADQKDWFDAIEVEVVKGQPKKKFLVLQHEPDVLQDGNGSAIPPVEGGGQPQLPRQRASFYKSDKMLISQGAELLRAVGIRISGALTPQAVKDAVTGIDGRVAFIAEVGWRAYFGSTETTFSTSPRKRRGELPWPRNADGSYQEMVVNPQTGEKAYGRADIMRVRLPKAS